MATLSLSRRVVGSVAAASLLVGLVSTAASAATPTPRDITKFACPSGEVPDPEFTDDDGTIHKASIACVVWYDIASGKTATTYAPKDNVNRAQMASFIGNLLEKAGVALPDSPPNAFPDDDSSPHHLRINQLAALGVVGGFEDGEYKPGLPVIRAQMATFINNSYEEATGSRLTSSQDYFGDDDRNIHEDNINAVAGAGIAAGTSSDTYAPHDPVVRDQMATFLARETDLLVEKGEIKKPVTKPADVQLTTTSVPQGGKVKGSIDTQDDVTVTGAKVTGCGITDHTLTLTGEANAFEFTIPVTQPTGSCELTFTVDREEGDSVTDKETITVTAGTSRTDAPELLTVEKASESGDDVVLRYTFDEALKALTLAPADFRLYDAAANQSPAKSAQVSGSTVNVTFTKQQFTNATTATVTANAVEDASGTANPEGAAPLAQSTTTVSGTSAPDLTDVARSVNEWFFDFDEPIVAHPGSAENYHLVLDDGNVLDGLDTTDETGDDIVQVTFPPVDASSGRTVVRAYVDTDTVAGSPSDGNPLNGVEDGNPTHAEDVAGGGETPHLVSATIDATNNQVIYTFNRAVTTISKGALDANSFIAYDLSGNEVGTNNATASGSKVTATFSGDPDPITGNTIGASVRPDAVRAASGTRLPNEVDEVLVKTTTTVTGARGGETSAPDLRSVTRSIDGNDSVLTYTFDQPVVRATAPPSTTATDGDFVIYQQDGTRTELDLNDPSGNECTASGNTVKCRAVSTTALGQQIDSAVLGGVEYNAVASDNTASKRNYEASSRIE